MKITFNTIKTSYANRSQEQKDSEKKMVAGGGAAAAAVSTARHAKTARTGFDVVSSSRSLSNGMTAVSNTSQSAMNVVRKSSGLWSKVCENAKWLKGKIITWGETVKGMKYIKPILKSRAFKFAAGAAGYAFGAITLISGIGEIATATKSSFENNPLLKS